MTYIVQRNDRFYVVYYDGLDPLTGKERRRWHPVGHDRGEAESVAARLEADRAGSAPARGGPVSVGEFLTDTWLPLKRRHVRATTAYRYSWFVNRYINPDIGDVPLRRLRADHLDGLYDRLATTAGRHGTGLAPKTVHEVHMLVRSCLDLAVRTAPRPQRRPRHPSPTWAADRPAAALVDRLRTGRLLEGSPPPAPVPGVALGRFHRDAPGRGCRAQVVRPRQDHQAAVDLPDTAERRRQPVEFAVKTRTSRRCVDIDDNTMRALARWRRRLYRDGLPHGPDDWMFLNTSGRFLNPESVTQLFNRIVKRTPGLPHVRLHDLRHTHASLLYGRRADKGRQRTPRALAPGLHDAHLPAPAARDERGRGRAVRRSDRRSEPVDVYRRHRREPAGQRSVGRAAGRRPR
ncbi:MAG TPA: tyrosine-type recombinase/integrase [Candidatus Dormibacteraeota bacterium]|nr:tyrosine-type recombinase/integrase [Candidatus Dormibacteraeota bacterium]